MKKLTATAFAVLSLMTAVAGAQQKPSQAAPKSTAHSAMPAPAISKDSAKAITLANVHGAKITSEKLETRNNERYYLFTLHEPNQKATVKATVDASTGKFTRLDKAPAK